jgi:hypothetical protein
LHKEIKEKMAEQFKKIYITAREFVASWEKEVYELNNMDYFIFILINQLGLYIRKDFFSDVDHKGELYLTDDEISALSFNIGDTLNFFMEKSCYNACPFRCPSHMKDVINPDEKYLREIFSDEDMIPNPSCRTKEDCFYMEVLNNVVLESLVDFYNYDKGVIFDVTDLDFYKFASIIVDQIVVLVTGKGVELLKKPFDNRSAIFEELLANTEDTWDFRIDVDDEENETEIWKVEHLLIDKVIEEYRSITVPVLKKHLRILDKLKEFLVDFIGLRKITDVNDTDIQEFMAIHFFHDLVVEGEESAKGFIEEVLSFLQHVDYYYKLTLSSTFNSFMAEENDTIERIISVCKGYFSERSYVDFVLSNDYLDESIDEGFFELVDIKGQKYTFIDIHLNQIYTVMLEPNNNLFLRIGDILHAQLIEEENRSWRIVSLEMIYPHFSKVYLL